MFSRVSQLVTMSGQQIYIYKNNNARLGDNFIVVTSSLCVRKWHVSHFSGNKRYRLSFSCSVPYSQHNIGFCQRIKANVRNFTRLLVFFYFVILLCSIITVKICFDYSAINKIVTFCSFLTDPDLPPRCVRN